MKTGKVKVTFPEIVNFNCNQQQKNPLVLFISAIGL